MEEYECNDDDPVELIMVSVVIDWLVNVGIALFVVALDDEILFVSLPILLLLDSKWVDVITVTEERSVLIGISADIDDCSSYELEVDGPTLEVGNVIGRIVYNDDVIAVRVDNVLNSLLVACSEIGVCDESVAVKWLLMLVEGVVGNVVSDIIVENVDGYMEVLTVVTGWTDDVSKIDVIIVELWSEIDGNVVISMIVICVDDDTEGTNKVSVELVTPWIVVVPTSVTKRVLVWGNDSVLILSEVIVEIDSIFELRLGVAVLIVSPVERVTILSVLIECSIADVILLVSANVDGVAISIFVVNSRDDCVFELWNEKLVVDSCVIDSEYKVDSTMDNFVVPRVSVSGDEVAVSMDVAYECVIVANDKYSPALDVSSTLRNVVSILVIEIPFVVVEIYSVVDSSDSTDEVWSPCELKRVLSIDVSDGIDSLFNVVIVTVDNPFVCPVEEGVWYDDSWDMDATTVEVRTDNVSENISALVDVSDDEDKEEYTVEVETCSLVVVKVLVKDSVDSELVLDTAGV